MIIKKFAQVDSVCIKKEKIEKMTRKVVISVLLLIIFSVNVCYAEYIEVTDENLNTAVQKIVSEQEEKPNVTAKVVNNKITITDNESKYDLNYDLTDKPTFYYEFDVNKDITYEEFETLEALLFNFVFLGYVAVANVQGIDTEDSIDYSSKCILMAGLENADNNQKTKYYAFLDDGMTPPSDDNGVIYVYKSQFGEYAVEYVTDMYSNSKDFSDKDGGLNSFEWKIEQKNKTDESCTLSSTLTINTDADFSKLQGYSDSLLNKEITKDNANYTVTLKVGQKCRFEANENFTGHEIYGISVDFEEINEKCIEFTGVREGVSNGRIYVGDTKKTFYITVEENLENETLETKVLKINNETENDKPNGGANGQQEQPKNNKMSFRLLMIQLQRKLYQTQEQNL